MSYAGKPCISASRTDVHFNGIFRFHFTFGLFNHMKPFVTYHTRYISRAAMFTCQRFDCTFSLLISVSCRSPGGASVQAQPHQPDGECDRVSADGVRRGGPTPAPSLLVQRQPASPPNVRCRNMPTQVTRRFTQQHRPPANSATAHACNACWCVRAQVLTHQQEV